ncbi:MAG TPA: hypothetical protein VMH05_02410 [Bryobacteraceae bacterium]|nr:hypothetical protein [Bryobacteraceae bacterium]
MSARRGLSFRCYSPGNTPAWTMRLQIAFLFPKLAMEQEKMLMEKQLKQMEEQPPQKN